MLNLDETLQSLTAVPNLTLRTQVPLSECTRFGIGGPADFFVETKNAAAFVAALQVARESGLPFTVVGSGSNLVVADAGYRGIILKFSGDAFRVRGPLVTVEAGAVLQTVVDCTAGSGLRGLETMTGIPGFTGAAVYGNAGAYGHSISESVASVTFHDGKQERVFENRDCEFSYRESIFKRRKSWTILSVDLELVEAEAAALQKVAAEILAIRNEKYPPTMRCAGSIFKNFLAASLPPSVFAALPAQVIREGKVPSAYFLEKVDAKGLRIGDIQVATYHANLIYNDGNGTAADLLAVIADLKRRVADKFGITLEEEVQYVGFGDPAVLT